MNGGGAEHPRREGWSFLCLFCGTQFTRVRIDGGVVESFISQGPTEINSSSCTE